MRRIFIILSTLLLTWLSIANANSGVTPEKVIWWTIFGNSFIVTMTGTVWVPINYTSFFVTWTGWSWQWISLPPYTLASNAGVWTYIPYMRNIWATTMWTLPTWLSLNSSTSEISGTPTTEGIWWFRINDDDWFDTAVIEMIISPWAPTLELTQNVTIQQGVWYTIGNINPSDPFYTYRTYQIYNGAWYDALPSGLHLNNEGWLSNGQLYGTSSVAWSYQIGILNVTDNKLAKVLLTISPSSTGRQTFTGAIAWMWDGTSISMGSIIWWSTGKIIVGMIALSLIIVLVYKYRRVIKTAMNINN